MVNLSNNKRVIVVPERRRKKVYKVKGKVPFMKLLKYKGDFYHHVCYKFPEAFTKNNLVDGLRGLKKKPNNSPLTTTCLKEVGNLAGVGFSTLLKRKYPHDKGILGFIGALHKDHAGSVAVLSRLNIIYFNYLNRLGPKKRDKLMKMQFRRMDKYNDFQIFMRNKAQGGNWAKSYKRRMALQSFLFGGRASLGYGHVNYLEEGALVTKDAGYLSKRRLEVLKRFVRKVRGNRRYYNLVDLVRKKNKWKDKVEKVSVLKKKVYRGRLLNLAYYNKALAYVKGYGEANTKGMGLNIRLPVQSSLGDLKKLGSVKKSSRSKEVKVFRRYFNKKIQRPKWTKAASRDRIGRRIIYGFLKEVLNVRVTSAHVAVAMEIEEEVEIDEDVLKYRDMFIYEGDRKGDVNKIVGLLSRSGKRSLGLVHLRKAFFIVKEVLKEDPGKVVVKALDNIEPIVGVRGIKRGKKVVSIPYLLRVGTRRGMARRWLMEAAYGRDKEDLGVGLGLVLIDAYRNIGPAVNKKNMLHKSVSNGIPLLNLMR